MGDLAPTTGPGAVAPATGTPRLPDHLGGAAPAAGNGASREMARPAGGAVARNLSRASWLDLLNQLMAQFHQDMERIRTLLAGLGKTSDTLDLVVANMEELGKLYEAPEATRSALDADAIVCALIADLVRLAGTQAAQVQDYNTAGTAGLRTMNNVQEHQRGMGAGPRLLQTAGRH